MRESAARLRVIAINQFTMFFLCTSVEPRQKGKSKARMVDKFAAFWSWRLLLICRNADAGNL
jgi:hypothetical protein